MEHNDLESLVWTGIRWWVVVQGLLEMLSSDGEAKFTTPGPSSRRLALVYNFISWLDGQSFVVLKFVPAALADRPWYNRHVFIKLVCF